MANEITLPVGASAEPDTCGSCKFFRRRSIDENRYYGMYGECGFKFPAKVVDQWALRGIDPKQKDREYTGNEDRIKDTDRCDLQQPDLKVYIVQRRIAPAGSQQ